MASFKTLDDLDVPEPLALDAPAQVLHRRLADVHGVDAPGLADGLREPNRVEAWTGSDAGGRGAGRQVERLEDVRNALILLPFLLAILVLPAILERPGNRGPDERACDEIQRGAFALDRFVGFAFSR